MSIIGECIWSVVRWVLLLPVLLALSTPLILIGALFAPGKYFESIAGMYSNVIHFWKEVALWL